MIPDLASQAGFTKEEWAHVLALVSECAQRDVVSIEDILCAALPGLIGPLTVNAFHKGLVAGREEHLSEIEERVSLLLRAGLVTTCPPDGQSPRP